MARLYLTVAVVALCGCTASITTTREDAFGGKFQTPFGWTIESGPGKSSTLKQPKGAGTVSVHEFPQTASCENALGESRLKLNGRRPWKQQGDRATVVVAGINEGSILGVAMCEIAPTGTFVVALSAPKTVWVEMKADLYSVADSYRRSDKRVFNVAPLSRVNPDGTITKPKDD